MKSNEGPKIGPFRKEVLSKTSLSLRLRFWTTRGEAPTFGSCSASVQLLFGFLLCSRSTHVRYKDLLPSSFRNQEGAPLLNDRFRKILDNLPDTTQRSCLEPYKELIQELRHRKRPYREIAEDVPALVKG